MPSSQGRRDRDMKKAAISDGLWVISALRNSAFTALPDPSDCLASAVEALADYPVPLFDLAWCPFLSARSGTVPSLGSEAVSTGPRSAPCAWRSSSWHSPSPACRGRRLLRPTASLPAPRSPGRRPLAAAASTPGARRRHADPLASTDSLRKCSQAAVSADR